jgi:poly-beta-1,6-N-acetyl-D-glucosamine synthase
MYFFWLILFWCCLFIVFYAYLGYGLLLFMIVKIKRIFRGKPVLPPAGFEPPVTLLIAAYNEEDYINTKIANTFALDYPEDKLQIVIVTDGSTDATPQKVSAHATIRLLHQPERQGKIAAVHRTMKTVETPFVIFTDANTLLNPEAVRHIIRHYADAQVGAVAGEKRIQEKAADAASGAGEGFYWKYESALKKWDSELYSVVGAAGELFSIRTELYEEIPRDTLIEDFYLTLRIAQKGFRVIYEPEATATETASADVKEELKRKIRIAAGGLQAISRLRSLLNPFRYGVLTFEYLSHRVLRWTLAPLALPLLLLANVMLALEAGWFYKAVLALQVLFYICVAIGHLLATKSIQIKAFFIPYYFFIMNYAVYAGFGRFMRGSQSVLWERAKRAE